MTRPIGLRHESARRREGARPAAPPAILAPSVRAARVPLISSYAPMTHAFHAFLDLMQRGGWIMWPLLAMSLAAVTLIVERLIFWIGTNSTRRLQRFDRAARLLRQHRHDEARRLVEGDESIYGRVVRAVAEGPHTEALAFEAVEAQRGAIERFMPMLSTIITAAPMLGILGTVTGIIASFNVLADEAVAHDPRAVSAGIAEALLTTAAGLIVALIVLFPYNHFRGQVDRTLGRLETLVAAAGEQSARPHGRQPDPTPPSQPEA